MQNYTDQSVHMYVLAGSTQDQGSVSLSAQD